MPVIPPALRRLRQEYGEFKANLGYTARPCLKKKERKKTAGKLFMDFNPLTKTGKGRSPQSLFRIKSVCLSDCL
jgi:hypothetical protein